MRVITYNIHAGVNRENIPTLLKICKYLKKSRADVICLQEVIYPDYLVLKKKLRMRGVFAENAKKGPSPYGICTFVRKKSFCHHHFFLTSKGEQRGALCVTFDNANGYTSVINTHLGLNEEERRTQMDEISNYVSSLVGNKIICGDFNEKNVVLSPYGDFALLTGEDGLTTFYPSNARIDYIFADSQMIPMRYEVENIKLSDHYPVIADCEKRI
ncbi:MAG: endonuclease/exonuclease/phosphatase family protein [Clostridioides sp.]|nr:endonuclease/exonuclease/phosphatase family protein [Clostridioides sp.]